MAFTTDWRLRLPLEINNFMADPMILALNGAERGAMVWLLMAQWRSGDGFLPKSEDYLQKASGLREEWPQARNAVLDLFEEHELGICYLPVRALWEQLRDAREAMAEGGRRGGKATASRLEGGLRGAAQPGRGSGAASSGTQREAQGSVARAVNGKAVDGGEEFAELLIIAESTAELRAMVEEGASVATGRLGPVESPQPANDSELLACQEIQKGKPVYFGEGSVEQPEPTQAEADAFAAVVHGDHPHHFAGPYGAKAAERRRRAEAEIQGAIPRQDSQQARVEPPIASSEAVLEGIEPETADFEEVDADELEALRLAGSTQIRRAAARQGGGRAWR